MIHFSSPCAYSHRFILFSLDFPETFPSLLSPIICRLSTYSPSPSKSYFYSPPPYSASWWKELDTQVLMKVAKNIILTHNGEVTSVRLSSHLLVLMYIFEIREQFWTNPSTVYLQQMLSDEYHCGPYRPKLTTTGGQRLLEPFTSRIKILLARLFATKQTAPIHAFIIDL